MAPIALRDRGAPVMIEGVRWPLLSFAALLAALLLTPAASAQVRFRECRAEPGIELGAAELPTPRCARLSVPLDPAGARPGRIAIHVERIRARGRRRQGAIFALAGGPGQAAAPFTADFGAELQPLLRSRDLVVMDQRGTGRSGVLRCRALERANFLRPDPRAPERCARQIGERRSFYTTRESVADIEAVRRRLRLKRISLYGVSYGTKVALAYAARYPARVEKLLLDSVLAPEGPDPFYRESTAALPRALADLCRGHCSAISAQPADDLGRLVRRLARRPLRGYVVSREGRRVPAAIDRAGLFQVVLAGDIEPSLRSGLPAAVRSALAGDAQPLLRLALRARRVEGQPEPPALFSVALYAATTCEEAPLPWPRAVGPAERLRRARGALAELPEDVFRPFDRGTALGSDVLALCREWPAGPEPPALAQGALPPVPALLLAGEQDLRTPLESARAVAERLPRGRLLRVRDTGHSVLGTDFSGCAARAMRNFFANRSVGRRCGGAGEVFRPSPFTSATLSGIAPTGGAGRRGRTLEAVRLTLGDVVESAAAAQRGGGLRAGSYSARARGFDEVEELSDTLSEEEIDSRIDAALARVYIDLRLDGVEYVRGVRVSGRLRVGSTDRITGTLHVSGGPASAGVLRVRGSGSRIVLSGRLDGRRVSQRGSLDGSASAAARSSARRSPVPGGFARPLAQAPGLHGAGTFSRRAPTDGDPTTRR